MPLVIESIDHFVLTVANIERSLRFYTEVLGMDVQRFGAADAPRIAVTFGQQKINLHQLDRIPDPNVLKATPGSADFCLVTSTPMSAVAAHLNEHNVAIVEGPVSRTGAIGAIESIYIRDPDDNLVEIANYLAR